jgi:hypothetical protein
MPSLGYTKVLYTLTLHIQDSIHLSKKDPRPVITTFEKWELGTEWTV